MAGIHIDDTYTIKADENQYILVERRIYLEGKNAGTVYEVALKYCRTVSDALQALIRLAQRKKVMTEAMTLHEAARAFHEIEHRYLKLLREGDRSDA